MRSHPVHAATLTCHPETPAAAVRAVSASVVRLPGTALAIGYAIEGDIQRLRVPAPAAPAIADRLWEHTCCEVFIARRGLPAYHELNFSPSGEWAIYAFERYRERVSLAKRPDAERLDPRISVRSSAGVLELGVRIRVDHVSPAYVDADLALALSAVVEERDGAFSYWALNHPPGRPDFHHADGYALVLAGSRPSSMRPPA